MLFPGEIAIPAGNLIFLFVPSYSPLHIRWTWFQTILKALVQSVVRLGKDRLLTLVPWVRTNSFIKAHLPESTLWVVPRRYLVLRDFGADSHGTASQHFGQAKLLISCEENTANDT